MSETIVFLVGFGASIIFLLAAVGIRTQYRKTKAGRKNKRSGQNSRESVGETIVAVLNPGTRKKKTITKPIWRKFLTLLGER